ncbi:Hypothetical protein D9617_23g006050 [Elsinoe fawcettii]|nr:Hypothetical protein D9617_23g006050 [Elsinoe fawcettii]
MANLETHWKSECPDRKFPCDLCDSMVFYREISLHARETCPAITIPCTGATYGCNFRAKRGAIYQHTKQCTFALFAPFLDAQSKRMSELEDQQSLLVRKLQVLEGGFSSVEKILQFSETHLAKEAENVSNRSSMAMVDDDGLSAPFHFDAPITNTELSPNEYYDPLSWPLSDSSTASPLETRIRGTLPSPSSLPSTRPPTSAFNRTAHPPDHSRVQIVPIDADAEPASLTPYTHLLSLHESLRNEVARVSSAITDLDGRHSMMMLNENLRLKEELAYLGGQVGGLGRQVGWLTGLRLQDDARKGNASAGSRVSIVGVRTPLGAPRAADAPESSRGVDVIPRRRLTDEGRTKL